MNKKIRSLSWVVLKWALDVRPRVLMMENVEEIQTWGPLISVMRGGKKVWVPDPEHSGETFTAFIGMLTPRELYNAMGFPPDYIIDVDWQGNVCSKTKQVARCGNAVCPPMAKAMVRANMPEYCIVDVSTLAEFCRLVSAGL